MRTSGHVVVEQTSMGQLLKHFALMLVVLLIAPSAAMGAEEKKWSEDTVPFRARVDAFWATFRKREATYRKEIVAGNATALAEELSGLVRGMIPGVEWELRPGRSKGREGLVLTTPYDAPKRLLVDLWIRRAPKDIPWDFFDHREAKGASSPEQVKVQSGTFASKDISFKSKLDEERRLFSFKFFHPRFKEMTREQRAEPIFRFLDWMLGERVVERRVGALEFSDTPIEHSDGTLDQIAEWFANETKSWDPLPNPLDNRFMYELNGAESGAAFRRDIRSGTSSLRESVYRTGKDPLAETGAALGTLMCRGYPAYGRPSDTALERIEVTVNNALQSTGMGRATGHAHGIDGVYVDLVFYDVDAALKQLRPIFEKSNSPSHVSWHALYGDRVERLTGSKDVAPSSGLPVFPDDENGNVLRDMASAGDDLRIPREMNFEHAFPTKASAEKMCGAVRKMLLKCSIAPMDWENYKFQVTVSKDKMTPTHDAVTNLEAELDALARTFGGEACGWGCFAQSSDEDPEATKPTAK